MTVVEGQLGWTFDPDRPVYQARLPAPKAPPVAGRFIQAILWSRSILCWHCTALIPLSPQWKLSAKQGIRVTPRPDGTCAFAVVPLKDMSAVSVAKGTGICFHCGGTQPKGYPSAEARAGRMGDQCYCVVIRNRTVRYRAGKPPVKGKSWIEFMVPTDSHFQAVKLRHNIRVRLGAPELYEGADNKSLWSEHPGYPGIPDPYAETDPSLLELGLFGGEESEWAPGVAAIIAEWGDE